MGHLYRDAWFRKNKGKIIKQKQERATAALKKIHNGDWDKTIIQEQFIPLPFNLIDNDTFRNKFMTKTRFRTYLWLRRNIVRGELISCPIKDMNNLYYESGLLATTMPLSKLSKDLNISKSTAGNHITQLENDGVVVVDIIPANETQDSLEHRVYILGTCLNHQERWFIDKAFNDKRKEEV